MPSSVHLILSEISGFDSSGEFKHNKLNKIHVELTGPSEQLFNINFSCEFNDFKNSMCIA